MQAINRARSTLAEHGYQIAIVFLLSITMLYCVFDGYLTWNHTIDFIFVVYNKRDWLMIPFVLIPLLAGHLLTSWGHYFRSDQLFHHSIQQVTLCQQDKDIQQQKKRSQKNPTHFWHRIWWGWSYKQWAMAAIIIAINTIWFGVAFAIDYPIYARFHGPLSTLGLASGAASGYAVLACTTWILFLILRRSMLQALGWTYAELVPFHRWLGVLITFWSTVHTIGYLIFYIDEDTLSEGFNFTGERGLMNMFGVFAYIALLILALFSIPQVRRKVYGIFMAMHRVMTVIYLVGTMAHFPYYMMWYYVLPSFVLFLLDRFVPKYIQTRTILPNATVTLDPNGVDIMRVTVRSRTPMKPYYPGDYILLQVPEIGTLYHPFTIASYYPEDPCAVTLFVRIYNESRLSWTPLLAKLGEGKAGHPVSVKVRADGIFGDRRHDYLESDVIVLFLAGVAITTFMALIKAIGAQIAATKNKGEPEPAFRMYLICSFKTESELYAYGSFFTQITADPRFTSWLETRIFVTRGDPPRLESTVVDGEAPRLYVPSAVADTTAAGKKVLKLGSDQCATADVDKPHLQREDSSSSVGLNRGLSGRTIVGDSSSSSSSSSSNNNSDQVDAQASKSSLSSSSTPRPSSPIEIQDEPALLRSDSVKTAVHDEIITAAITIDGEGARQQQKTQLSSAIQKKHATSVLKMHLPTFEDVNSRKEATRLARDDLHLSMLLVVVPLMVWFGSKAIYWEGYNTPRCQLRGDMSFAKAMYCFMAYSLFPGLLHCIAMSIGGYLALHLARKAMRKELIGAIRGSGAEAGHVPYPEVEVDLMEEEELARQALERRGQHGLAFERGRMEVETIMRDFMHKGIGGCLDGSVAVASVVDDESGRSVDNANNHSKIRTATVLAGGPDSFVERIETMTKQVRWAVDFHRETWAP